MEEYASFDLKTLSVLQANELFVQKILSRNSSVGSSSSRSYFGRATGAVPFQWEVMPGKPKLDLLEEEQQHFVPDTPFIGPPPATQSLNLPRFNHSGPLSHSKVWLWKKLKKGHKVKKNRKNNKVEGDFSVDGLNQFYHPADMCKCDEENMKFYSCESSSYYHSSSLSSTVSGSSNSSTPSDGLANFRPSKIRRLARGFIKWAF